MKEENQKQMRSQKREKLSQVMECLIGSSKIRAEKLPLSLAIRR